MLKRDKKINMIFTFFPIVILAVYIAWKFGRYEIDKYPGILAVSFKDRLLGFILWLTSIPTLFLGGLIIWLKYKNISPFINQTGINFLNFWLTYFIYGLVIRYLAKNGSLTLIKLAIYLTIITLVFKIIGSIFAIKGRSFIAPFSFKFIK